MALDPVCAAGLDSTPHASRLWFYSIPSVLRRGGSGSVLLALVLFYSGAALLLYCSIQLARGFILFGFYTVPYHWPEHSGRRRSSCH